MMYNYNKETIASTYLRSSCALKHLFIILDLEKNA